MLEPNQILAVQIVRNALPEHTVFFACVFADYFAQLDEGRVPPDRTFDPDEFFRGCELPRSFITRMKKSRERFYRRMLGTAWKEAKKRVSR